MNQKPKITFIPVATNQDKMGSLCRIVQKHFELQQSMIIITPNEQAEQFVNDLLWKFPPDSFIPHAIAKDTCQDFVVITTVMRNLNDAKILINLCPQPNPIIELFEMVYELFDETHPSKLEQSKLRLQAYRNYNPIIEAKKA